MEPQDSHSVISQAAEARVYFPNLDALRTLAFLTVYLCHSSAEMPRSAWRRLDEFVFRSGNFGVSFFFVLSGFLITYLILKEFGVTGKLDLKAFYARRFLRIWPLYFLVVILGIMVYPWLKQKLGYSPHLEIGDRWMYFVFLGNFDLIRLGPGHGASFTNITWSVAIEEQFYLVWPLLFILVRPRHYPAVFVSIIAASSLYRAIHYQNGMVLYFHTLSVISDMGLGGLAAYIILNCPKAVVRIKAMPRWFIVGAYTIALLLFFFRDLALVRPMQKIAGELGLSFFQGSFRLLTGTFFAFVVVEQNFANYSFIKMGRIAVLTALGRYTYGLYLFHPFAILAWRDMVKIFWKSAAPGLSSPWSAPIPFLFTVVAAVVSYHLYEKPFLALKKKLAHIDSSG